MEPRLLSFYLSALRDLGEALAAGGRRVEAARPLRESLQRVMGTFAIGRGALLLWDAEDERLHSAAAKGCRPPAALPLSLTRGQIKALASGGRPFHPHLAPGGLESMAERLRGPLETLAIQWIAPLATGSAFLGLLLLGGRINGERLSTTELNVLEEMAGLLALRLDEARARKILDAQVRQLQKVNRQLRQIYLETVRALAGVIDGPEVGHSVRVAALAQGMGRRLGLGRERCERLYLAGLLHDIGKQIISRELLEKNADLNDEERRIMETHPAVGCELLSHLRFPWGDVAEIVRHHHERLDGKGYPDQLKAGEISLEAKVLMMAEAFDSMTSDQSWRPRLPPARVAEQIGRNLDLQFEPRVVRALCDAVEAGLAGDSGEEAEFVPHLEAAFDPALIREMLRELRRQLRRPTFRPEAVVLDLEEGKLG